MAECQLSEELCTMRVHQSLGDPEVGKFMPNSRVVSQYTQNCMSQGVFLAGTHQRNDGGSKFLPGDDGKGW